MTDRPTTNLESGSAAIGNLAFGEAGPAMAQMARYANDLKRLLSEQSSMLDRIEKANVKALTVLCRAAEYHDDDTGVHMDRVGVLSQLLARLSGRSEEEARLVRFAAPMHDIGKMAIPDAILKKMGSYTPEEREVMNRHPILGAEILGQSDVPVFQMAAEVSLTHHENWDGTGYPAGMRGDQIPWTGRVVALIDFFDALTMDRVYRRAFSDEQALGMVREQRGKKFDPDLVDLFLANVVQFIHLRDDINASSRDHGALIRPDGAQLAAEMGL